MVHLYDGINVKNNLPQLGASTWQGALRASPELTQQSPLKLGE